MENIEHTIEWLEQFPGLMGIEPQAIKTIQNSARFVEAEVGTIGYCEGMPCKAYILRLAGKSRVYKISASGREILLYRVSAGETCVLTTTCLLGNSNYPASTIVEEPIRDVVIPKEIFHQLILESNVFRRFVMGNYGALISNLIVLLDEVAFLSLDIRLAKHLLEFSKTTINQTHQELAAEIGTAREVISRQLKHFEQKGWLALGRGHIKITDRYGLENFANTG